MFMFLVSQLNNPLGSAGRTGSTQSETATRQFTRWGLDVGDETATLATWTRLTWGLVPVTVDRGGKG